jgi:HEAT repeat protein
LLNLSVKELYVVLATQDYGARMRNDAANLLLNKRHPELAGKLMKMLNDRSEARRWRNYCVQLLAASFEQRADKAVLAALFRATVDNVPEVSSCAVWSLAVLAAPSSGKLLLTREEISRVQVAARRGLREDKRHYLERIAGAQSCGRLGLSDMLPVLRKLADSEDTILAFRVVCVAALGQLEDTESRVLLKSLATSPEIRVRRAAWVALGRLREADARARAHREVADRVKDLEHSRASVREMSARTLGRLEGAGPAIPALKKCILDRDPCVRVAAINALRKIQGQHGLMAAAHQKILREAVPGIVKRLDAPEASKKRHAIGVLKTMGRAAEAAIPALIENAKTGTPRIRTAAIWAIGEIGGGSREAAAFLRKLLKDESAMIRKSAVTAIGATRPAGKDVVSTLSAVLVNDSSATVRQAAASALGRQGQLSRAALLQALSNKHPDVREEAALQLEGVPETADAALPLLAPLLGDRYEDVRNAASQAMGGMGKKAVPYLTKALGDKKPMVRLHAARALGLIGGDARVAGPAVANLLGDKDERVRRSASDALRAIRPKDRKVVVALVETFKGADPAIRDTAIDTLGHIGPAAATAIPALLEMLKKPGGSLRMRVTTALGRIGAPAVSTLITLLDHEDVVVRAQAALALGKIGPEANRAAPKLISLLKDHQPGVRRSAARSLGRLRVRSIEVCPLLIGLTSDKSQVVRKAAARALGDLGASAASAIPALEKLLSDENREVRRSARRALAKVAPGRFQ